MRMYMPWETYKTLKKDLKEEYNLRFSDAHGVSIASVAWMVLFLGLVTSNLLFVTFLIVTNPVFQTIQLEAITIMQVITQLIMGTGWAIVLVLLYDIIIMVIQYIQYRKWLHENNIKREYVWTKWLEKLK